MYSELLTSRALTRYDSKKVPPDWMPITHPEGALYFRYRHAPILTGVNLCDREKLEHVEAFIGQIDALAKNFDTEGLELVVELLHDEDKINCGYYFVDHKSRLLLWLEEHDISNHISEIKGAKSSAHIRMVFPAFLLLPSTLFMNLQ